MEAKLQLRVQRYGWDAAASVYEDEWQQHLAPAHQILLNYSDLEAGLDIFETAAGTGLVTFPVANTVGPTGSVVATDLSGAMVDTGNDGANELGLTNVCFRRQNAEALECEDNSFDRAICALGLMYMPDPDAALTEMKRVLRPGGIASTLVWGERRNCGWAEIFPIVDSHVNSEVCPMFFGLGSQGALSASLAAAGFSSIKEERIKTTLTFDSPERVLSAVIDGGPVALAAKRFDEDTREAVNQAFLASVEAYRTGNGFEIPGEFVVASGVC